MTQHICFLSPYIYPSLVGDAGGKHAGGAEMQQAQIARLLARNGFRVSVLTRDFGQTDRQQIDGITVHKLPNLGQRGVRGLKWINPRLTDAVAALRAVGPDLVYVRTASAYAAAAAWYARRHGARFLYAGASDSNFLPVRDRNVSRRDWWLYRWGLRRADLILAQNAQQAQDVAQHLQRPAALCPNFLTDPAARPGSADGPVIWVGTMRPLKQPQLFAELARRMPQRQFVLVGGAQADPASQALQAELQAMAAALPNLSLRGHVPPQQVGSLFDGAAALINTSTHEGFPNTFLQAWIRGVPSLSFVAPQVEAGVCGTLPCGSVDEMSQRLAQVLSDPLQWEAHSTRVRAHFQTYHDEPAAQRRYLALLAPELAR